MLRVDTFEEIRDNRTIDMSPAKSAQQYKRDQQNGEYNWFLLLTARHVPWVDLCIHKEYKIAVLEQF